MIARGAERSLTARLLPALAVAILSASIVWPGIVAVGEALHADPPAPVLATGRLALLLRGAGIAVAAALAALLLGAGLAAGLLCAPRWWRGWLPALGLAALLTPPYVYAYAWSLLLLRGGVATALDVDGAAAILLLHGRAVLCLATWLAPLAAVILAAGWRSAGRSAVALAALDLSAPGAFVRFGLRAMGPWILLALLTTGLLALSEFTICHLCLVLTWNTQILIAAQQLHAPGAVARLAWPLLAVLLLLCAALWPLLPRLRTVIAEMSQLADDPPAARRAGRPTRAVGAVLGLLAAALILAPIGILVAAIDSPASVWESWRRYGVEWPGALRSAALGAALSVAAALGVAWLAVCGEKNRRSARFAGALTLVAVIGAISPPAVVGDALAAAWQWPLWVRDSEWLVAFVGVGRFVLIPILAIRLAIGGMSRTGAELAASDGASPTVAFWRIRVLVASGALAGSFIAVGVLLLMEASASQLVRPPGVGNIAVTLLNAIHFGRDAQVAAMCLLLAAIAATCGAVMGAFIGRRGDKN
ncbi:MAG: hypothetical protein HRU75_02370 [Planctomycetia bacterium]|nr:MAG: hypothetical protein HRU75_02370 [Planctomycetia bacterium]